MKQRILVVIVIATLFASQPAFAWWNGGHEIAAYIAYQKLNTTTRARVDALIKLNPMYAQWTVDVEDSKKPLVAFMKAATWPDCIKQASCAGRLYQRRREHASWQSHGRSEHRV